MIIVVVVVLLLLLVIFKHLSLKDLSALQDHEGGGGGRGNKIITQMFLSDPT